MNIELYRSEFPITQTCCFLNHAAVSPLSQRVVRAINELCQEMATQGIRRYPQWECRIEEVRALFAKLIGANSNDIAFVTNTSEGLSIVASGYPWRQGDKVITVQPDFPSNIYPWMNLQRLGVRVVVVNRREGRFDVEDVKRAIGPGTRMLAVSSVDFSSGHYCDLKALGELCQQKGIVFCVDAIQSLGLIPMDVKDFGIHILAAGGQKWLLGPMGCGGLFVAEEVRSVIHPAHVGWKSVINEEDFFHIHFHLKHQTSRFEPGTLNLFGIYALGAAIELLLEVGVERIYERVMGLNDQFIHEMRQRGIQITSPLAPDERSGILCFSPSSDAKKLFSHFVAHGVMVSERNGKIRISPHFYNNYEDVERFFDVLDTI